MVGSHEITHCWCFQSCIKAKTLWGCNFAIILKNYLSKSAKSVSFSSHLRPKLLVINFYLLWNFVLVNPLTVQLIFIKNIKILKFQSFLNFFFTVISFSLWKKNHLCVSFTSQNTSSSETYGICNNWLGFKLYPV